MQNVVSMIQSLETSMWEAALHKNDTAFLQLVSPDAIMICGGYRCSGQEYARFIKEGIASGYSISEYEIICEEEQMIQVHYVVTVEANEKEMADCQGRFHVTSTWKKSEGSWQLIFNMDSRIQ